MLKSNLKCFTKNLKNLVNVLKIILKEQYNKYITKIKNVKIKTINNLSTNLIKKLTLKITLHALQLIKKQ